MRADVNCEGFDTCGSVVPSHESELRLRAMGWHRYVGAAFAPPGQLDKWLCPDCLKKRRNPKAQELEGQEGLF